MTFILVVEDDPDFSALYQTALVERGYLVGLASSVQDGLEQLERVHPDFVVVDLDLPDGSGLSVVRAAARHSPPIPAVIASGSGSEAGLAAGIASGACDVLFKPFPMSLLISKVDLHLQRPTAVDALIPGGRAQAFGRYELLDTIGRGGCGVVYRAVDLHQGGEVALKVHTTQPGGSGDATNRLRRRFQREAYSLSSVEHENLAQIRGHGSERGLDYLAMELVPGETLEAYVEREGPLGEPALRALLERLARALSAIHARGLVHRDLKPANIVLREGRPADPVLVDFGLAKLVYDRSLTLDGERYGTPAFMAPEQVIGEDASSQTDLFSLGLVACYAASGQCAFPSLDLSALLRARCSRPSQVPAGLSPGLRSALSRLTKIRSSRRTSTANDLLRELAGLPSVGLAELAGR